MIGAHGWAGWLDWLTLAVMEWSVKICLCTYHVCLLKSKKESAHFINWTVSGYFRAGYFGINVKQDWPITLSPAIEFSHCSNSECDFCTDFLDLESIFNSTLQDTSLLMELVTREFLVTGQRINFTEKARFSLICKESCEVHNGGAGRLPL